MAQAPLRLRWQRGSRSIALSRRSSRAALARSAPLEFRPVMNYEETAILNFLRGSPDAYLARREIARKALKRTIFEENPHWADAPLGSLVDQG